MAYAKEEGVELYDQNVYINMDDIDDIKLLWIRDYRDKRKLILVDLDHFPLFNCLQRRLANDVGVIGFVGLDKYMEDYHCISLHRRIRRVENVHFFINRHNNEHLENIVYSYKTYDEHLGVNTEFVLITSKMPLFEGETIRNERGRRVKLISPTNLGGYIDDLII